MGMVVTDKNYVNIQNETVDLNPKEPLLCSPHNLMVVFSVLISCVIASENSKISKISLYLTR